MKITVTREIKEEVEVEITFPAYFKKGDYFIKSFNEAQNVWIRGKDICHNYLGLEYILEQNYDKSTAEEFTKALEAAIKHIQDLNNLNNGN